MLITREVDTSVNFVHYWYVRNLRQLIEYFHLVFLDHLGRKIDKRFYVLKGGCNLRFYFQSFRYSEDIDFDAQIIRSATLSKNVTAILESSSLGNILQTNGLEVTNISTPKQTATTQRWKVALKVTDRSLEIHTKIEFSRRNKGGTTLFEAINSSITQSYNLPPIFLSHYDRTTTVWQKIAALAGRSVTQARDVFDLYLLIGNQPLAGSNFSLVAKNSTLSKTQFTQALDNLSGVNYQDFQSQVVTYLAADYQKTYADEAIWQQIVATVRQLLLGNYDAT